MLATKPNTPRRSAPRFVASRLATLPIGDHTDPGTQGLQLRVRATRTGTSRTWLFRYRWRGEWVRLTFGHFPGTDLADARATVGEFAKNIDEGIDPRRARPKRNPNSTPPPTSAAVSDKHSIEFLVAEFMERHVKATRKRPEYAQRILDHDVLPEWKGRDARTIAPHEVIALLDRIVDRGSKVLANRAAGLLAQMFKFGIHRTIVTATPVQLLYRPGGKEKPRERSLSEDELKIFLVNVEEVHREPRTAACLKLLLLTGQRRGEITAARWSNVNLKAKTWTIPDLDAKAGKGHVVPLTESAVTEFELLQRLAKKSKFVFPNDDGTGPADPKLITRSLARCQTTWKKKGVAAFTPHDLRRTCRTGLAKLKIAPHIAERVLNHAQEKIPGTYDTHDYLDEKRDALEKWAAHLQQRKSNQS